MDTQTNLSDASIARLDNVHPDLVRLVKEVSLTHQIMVMTGFRDEEAQNEAFATGHSKERWPNSKHNQSPSQAVDITLLPYDPANIPRLLYFAGFVMGVASKLKIPLRFGGDWMSYQDPSRNKFNDLFHFELSQTTTNN